MSVVLNVAMPRWVWRNHAKSRIFSPGAAPSKPVTWLTRSASSIAAAELLHVIQADVVDGVETLLRAGEVFLELQITQRLHKIRNVGRPADRAETGVDVVIGDGVDIAVFLHPRRSDEVLLVLAFRVLVL